MNKDFFNRHKCLLGERDLIKLKNSTKSNYNINANKFFGQILYSEKKLRYIYLNINSKTVSQLEIFPQIRFIIHSLIASKIIKFITNKGHINFEKILTMHIFLNEFFKISTN